MNSTATLRILVVDDDQGDFFMAQAMLGQIAEPKIEAEWASSFDEALEALRTGDHDLFLVDYFLEERTGLDLLREARDLGVRTPMIMITGKGSRSVDLEAMEIGAADYLVKGQFDPSSLERSIRYTLERTRAAEALRASEERHRGMFDHLPMGLYRCSPEGEFVDANPALVRMLGFPDPVTLKEQYARDFYLSAEDRDRFLRLVEADGEVRGFETQVADVQGRLLTLRHAARAHRTPDGSIEYLEGAVEDVSAQGGTGRARLHAMTQEMGLAIVRVDLNGRVVEISPEVSAVLGYTPGHLGDLQWVSFFAESEREMAGDDLERAFHGLGSKGERRMTGPSGREYWARLVLAPVLDIDNDPVEVLALLQDISEA